MILYAFTPWILLLHLLTSDAEKPLIVVLEENLSSVLHTASVFLLDRFTAKVVAFAVRLRLAATYIYGFNSRSRTNLWAVPPKL